MNSCAEETICEDLTLPMIVPLFFPHTPRKLTMEEQKDQETWFRFGKIFAALRKLAPHHADDWSIMVQNSTSLPAQSCFTTCCNQECLDFSSMAVYEGGRLDLCNIEVGDRDIGALMCALEHNQYFRHILLGDNDFGSEGAKAMAQYVRSHLGHGEFETWYLPGNELSAESMHILCDAWTVSSALKALWLSRNPLGVEGVCPVRQLLVNHTSLEVLDLDECALLDRGVEVLCEGLASNKSLRHLYLGVNRIGPAGAANLARLLASDECSLKSLVLDRNRFGDEGAVHLAEGLRSNKSLERLIISSNNIGPLGITAVANSIAQHLQLRTVFMGDHHIRPRYRSEREPSNCIGVAGALAIVDMLRRNPRLQVLSVTHYLLHDDEMICIAEAVAEHPALLDFDLCLRDWNAELGVKVHARLMRNIRQLYGDDMSYESFLDHHLEGHRNIPQIIHTCSILYAPTLLRQEPQKKYWRGNRVKD